jgi:uncharacterized protein with beta-barrel porin domain
MQGRAFCRGFRRVAAVLPVVLLVGISGVARAQTIVSATFNRATKIVTAQDSLLNLYTANLSTASMTSVSTVNGTFTPPNGPTTQLTYTVDPTAPGQFSVSSSLPSQLSLSCGVNILAVAANCGLAPSPVLQSNIAGSLAASETGVLRSQANAVTDAITDRLRAVSRDLAQGLSAESPETPPGGTVILKDFSSDRSPSSAYRGLSAGSADTRWGVWADSSGSFLNNDTATGYNGTSVVALTGLDYIVDQRWIAGFSAGYTHAGLSLTPSTITRQVDGAVFGPYGSYIINSNLAIDALFNYTSLSNNIAAPVPLPSGGYHGDRLTGATDLDLFTNYDALKLTAYMGYLYAWEGSNSTLGVLPALANNIRYGAIRVGGEAAYSIGAFEPYLPVTYEYETTTPNDGTSRSAIVVGAGLRYHWSDTLTGGLLAETTEIKTHARDVLVEGNLRWGF